MRIGEIKSLIEKVLDENNTIQLNHEPIYGNQAHKVNNFGEIIEALDVLSSQKWNDSDYTQVEQIKSKHADATDQVVLTVDEFNQLNSYLGTINPKIPLFYLTLDSLTKDQDRKTINVKLASNINSLAKLSEVNKSLEDSFKLFNVDGEFVFKGFDKGSEWYELVTSGYMTYGFIIACLKIAKEYFKVRTEYFKSEQAKIGYEASLKEETFEKYQDRWLKIFVEEEVNKAVREIGTHGQTEVELQTKLIKATEKLIKVLEEGTEFHLSLNPPSYASEERGELKIDYSKIKESLPKEDKSVKALEDGGGKKKNKSNS